MRNGKSIASIEKVQVADEERERKKLEEVETPPKIKNLEGQKK